MVLSLTEIADLSWGPERTQIEIMFADGGRTVVTRQTAAGSLEDTWEWLDRSFRSGRPVAFDADDDLLLPVTVAFSIEVEDGDDGVKVWGEPRPAAMEIDRMARNGEVLKKRVREAEASGQGAIFALRDGLMIEDVSLVTEATALRLLGMSE